MKRDEKGFTFVELIVALGIIALVGGAAAMTTFQVFKGTERNSDHMTVVRQVQNAGYWISRDAYMAQSVTVDNLTAPNFLVLNWIEADSGDQYQVTYTLENMAAGTLKTLRRNHSINGGAANITFIAHYIDPDPQKTRSELNNGMLILTVTASVSNGSLTESETGIYQVAPRPG